MGEKDTEDLYGQEPEQGPDRVAGSDREPEDLSRKADLETDPDMHGEDELGGDAVAVLKNEIAGLREALLRTRADAENARKRAEREIEKVRRFGQERIIQDLLPVIDSLDQGLSTGNEADPARLSEGMSMTRKMLLKVLEDRGLEVLDPEGEGFDPNWHEAMTTQPSADHEPDTVVQVLQKGFSLNDRLLRPARVIVSRPPED